MDCICTSTALFADALPLPIRLRKLTPAQIDAAAEELAAYVEVEYNKVRFYGVRRYKCPLIRSTPGTQEQNHSHGVVCRLLQPCRHPAGMPYAQPRTAATC